MCSFEKDLMSSDQTNTKSKAAEIQSPNISHSSAQSPATNQPPSPTNHHQRKKKKKKKKKLRTTPFPTNTNEPFYFFKKTHNLTRLKGPTS